MHVVSGICGIKARTPSVVISVNPSIKQSVRQSYIWFIAFFHTNLMVMQTFALHLWTSCEAPHIPCEMVVILYIIHWSTPCPPPPRSCMPFLCMNLIYSAQGMGKPWSYDMYIFALSTLALTWVYKIRLLHCEVCHGHELFQSTTWHKSWLTIMHYDQNIPKPLGKSTVFRVVLC